MQDGHQQFIQTLAAREKARDDYWLNRDPIRDDRLLWRCQSFRHLVHLMPGQTVLELGCGQGLMTRQLFHVSRELNPITAVSFMASPPESRAIPENVELVESDALPGALAERTFDFIVVTDLLDKTNCAWLLTHIHDLLKPGGQVVFFESNPWNLVLKVRRSIQRLIGKSDPRRLLSRPEIYELISEIGFVRVFAIFNDFLYAPLTPAIIWFMRGVSVVLENTPGLRTMAGSIMIHAQRPPRKVELQATSLFEHDSLRQKVSVVVPCHNEEMNVDPMVKRLLGLYSEYIHEIVLVDDNSTDRTADVLRTISAENPIVKPVFRAPPGGVGRAIADGYRASTGDFVLSMDCDFHHLLPELRDVFDAAAEGYDVVVGSRFSRHSVLLNYPLMKIIANRGFHFIAQIMLLRRFRDLTNNLKLMRREVVRALNLTQPGFAVNAETGLQPLLMGFRIKEVPVSWINRTPDMGVSSFRLLKVGGGYWQVLLRLWVETVLGRGRQTETL